MGKNSSCVGGPLKCSHLCRVKRAVGRERNPRGVSADGESSGCEFAQPH